MIKWLVVVALLINCLNANAKTSLTGLSIEQQKKAIHNAAKEIRKALPVEIDKTITWNSMYYVEDPPSLEGIYLHYTTDISYENIDANLTASLKQGLFTFHTNTICTNDTYRQFMFVTGVTVRVAYNIPTGQQLLHFVIDKDVCSQAGYTYP
jgi:hypothetical protein